MKFICDKNTLTEAAINSSRAVMAKSTIQALEGILITTSESVVTLTGYDLEIGITTNIKADIVKPGAIVVSSKIFCDILKKLDSDTVEITSDNALLIEISGGNSHFSIMGSSADNYPEIPVLSEKSSFNIGGLKLCEFIDKTFFAISTNDQKPIQTGALFDISAGTLTVVTADGYRLALKKDKIDFNNDISFVVPSKTLADLRKMVEDDVTVKVSISDKHIIFDFEGYTIISRIIDGNFLNYKSTIPKNHTTKVNIETDRFIQCIERTSLIINDSKIKSPIKIFFEENTAKFTCNTPLGKSYDELSLTVEGDDVNIGFNNRYLLDALKAASCENLDLFMNGALSPLMISGADESFLYLVLPVRLKNED